MNTYMSYVTNGRSNVVCLCQVLYYNYCLNLHQTTFLFSQYSQLDELRDLLTNHESQLAERARTLQKLRIQRGAAGAPSNTQNGSK